MDLWWFLSSCLDLFDDTLRAMLDLPVLRFFLAVFLMGAVAGLMLALISTSKSIGK